MKIGADGDDRVTGDRSILSPLVFFNKKVCGIPKQPVTLSPLTITFSIKKEKESIYAVENKTFTGDRLFF